MIGKTCPYCGNTMNYIHERHDELEYAVYEQPYWECFSCGMVTDTNDDEDEGELYYEDKSH